MERIRLAVVWRKEKIIIVIRLLLLKLIAHNSWNDNGKEMQKR